MRLLRLWIALWLLLPQAMLASAKPIASPDKELAALLEQGDYLTETRVARPKLPQAPYRKPTLNYDQQLLDVYASFGPTFTFLPMVPPPPPLTYYVGPSVEGTGTCLTSADRCQFTSVWSLVAAGDMVSARAGTSTAPLSYAGSPNMITPTIGLAGGSGNRVKIVCETRGGCDIDGQSTRQPVRFQNVDWFELDGFYLHDAGTSGGVDVLELKSGSANNWVHHCMVWDTLATYNAHGIDVWGSGTENNLIEDNGVWGIGRKNIQLFGCSGGCPSGGNIVRRNFTVWDGTQNVGPAWSIAMSYYNQNGIAEDNIMTIRAATVQQTYSWYNNGVLTGSSASNYDTGLYGITGNDVAEYQSGTKGWYGNIMYVLASISPRHPSQNAVFFSDPILTNQSLKDNTVVYDPAGSWSDKRAFALYSQAGNSAISSERMSSYGAGLTNISGAIWSITNSFVGTSYTSHTGGNNPYEGTQGANHCFRYENGTLTATKKWRWSTNQLILDAMTYSGYAAINVDSTIQQLLGAPPAACTDASAPTATPTSTPTNTSTPTSTPTPVATNTPPGATFTPTSTATPTPFGSLFKSHTHRDIWGTYRHSHEVQQVDIGGSGQHRHVTRTPTP